MQTCRRPRCTRTSSHLGQLPDPRGTFNGGFGHHRLGAAGHQATRRSRWSCDRATRAATPPPIIWSFWSGPHADPGPVALQEGPDPGRRSWLLPRPDHRPFPARPGLLRGLPGDRGRPRRDAIRLAPGLGLAGCEQHRRWLREQADVIEVTGLLDLEPLLLRVPMWAHSQ